MLARALIALCILPLAACGPRMEGERIAGRTVIVTNKEDGRLSITKIVANDAEDRAECVDEPGTALEPGRSYTTTFMLCEEVREVNVHTDQGRREIDFE